MINSKKKHLAFADESEILFDSFRNSKELEIIMAKQDVSFGEIQSKKTHNPYADAYESLFKNLSVAGDIGKSDQDLRDLGKSEVPKGTLKDAFVNYLDKVNEETNRFAQSPLVSFVPSDYIQNKVSDQMKTTIRSIALSPDQRQLMIVDEGGYLYLFNITGSEIRLLALRKIESQLLDVAYSEKGNKIVVGTQKGSLHLFNLEGISLADERVLEIPIDPKDPRASLAIRVVGFSPDGNSVLCGSTNGKLKKFYLEKVNEGKSVDIIEHQGGVCALAYCSTIKKYATGGNDKVLNIFTLSQDGNKAENIITISKHRHTVRSVAFSLDGRFLISGSYDKSLIMFDPSNGNELLNVKGHPNTIYSVAISPDCNYILSGCQDSSARLFDRESGAKIRVFKNKEKSRENEDYALRSVLFKGESKMIIAGEEGVVKIFAIAGLKSGNPPNSNPLEEKKKQINCIDVSEALNKIITGGEDGTVRLYDLNNGFEKRRYAGNESAVLSVKFSSDNKVVLSAGEDCILRMYDVFSGTELMKYSHHNLRITAIVFSPNGDEFATCSEDKTVNVYNYVNRDWLTRLPKDELKERSDPSIKTMFFSPDGRWIAVGGYDKDMKKGKISLYSKDGKKKKHLLKSDKEKDFGNILKINFVNDTYLVAKDESAQALYIIEIKDFDLECESKEEVAVKILKVDHENMFIKNDLVLFSKTSFICILTCYDENKEIIYFWDFQDGVPNDWKNATKIFETEEAEISSNVCIVREKSGNKLVYGTYSGKPKVLRKTFESNPPQLSDEHRIKELKGNKLEESVFLKPIENLIINQEGSKIVIYFKSGVISVFDVYSQKYLNKFTGEAMKHIRYIKYSPDPDKIYLIMVDGTLRIMNIQTNESVELIQNTDNSRVALIEFVNHDDVNMIFCVLTNGTVRYYDLNKDDKPVIISNKAYSATPILLCPVKRKSKARNKKEDLLYDLLVLYRNGSLRLFSRETPNGSEKILNKLDEQLTCAKYSPAREEIIMGGEDNLVRILKTATKGENFFKGHEAKITAVSFIRQSKQAVSASEDRVIKIFDTESSLELFTSIMDDKINEIVVSSMKFILLGTQSGLRMIDTVIQHNTRIINHYSQLVNEKDLGLLENLNRGSLDLLPKELNISLLHLKLGKASELDVLKEVVEILSSSKVDRKKKILGECIFLEDTINRISPWDLWIDQMNNNPGSEQVILENLIVLLLNPYTAHIENMKNKPEFIANVARKCPGYIQAVLDIFLKSADPMTMEKHRMTTVMEGWYIWDSIKTNIKFFGVTWRSLKRLVLPIVLHTKSPNPCSRILGRKLTKECEYYEGKSKGSKSCACKANEKSYLFVKITKISLDELVNVLECKHDSVSNRLEESHPLKFKKFGNPQSIKPRRRFLLELFSNFSPEDPLFKSELLSMVVNYIWNLDECVGYSFYRRLLMFVFFQIIVCLNCLHFIPRRQELESSASDYKTYADFSMFLDISILFLLGVWVINRIIRLVSLVYKYLKHKANDKYSEEKFRFSTILSVWNLLDYLICLIGMALFTLDLYHIHTGEASAPDNIVWVKFMSAIFFAISWFKLFEFARGFRSTASFTRLLSQVTKDMTSYLIIIMFMVVGLAFTMFILQKSYAKTSLWHFFKITYGILIGNSGNFAEEPQAFDRELYFIVLFFATIYLVIIMLNILIAIVNNSFGKFIEKESQNEIYEKLNIICDRIFEFSDDKIKRLKRKLKKDYLFQFRDFNTEEDDEQQLTKLNDIQSYLENNTIKQEDLEKTVKKEFNSNNKKIDDKFQELSNEIKSNFEELSKKLQQIMDNKA